MPTLLVTLKILAADPRCLQILLAEAPWFAMASKIPILMGKKDEHGDDPCELGGYSIFRQSQVNPFILYTSEAQVRIMCVFNFEPFTVPLW